MTITFDDLQFDQHHLWHPYTNLSKPTPVFGVESADGVWLNLSNGARLVDGMSSWWSAIHGYNHPVLNQAAVEQIQKMSHVMFGGLTHQPAIDLAKRLVSLLDESLQCVFLADSGSVSVEVAIKMALQFWVSQQRSEKHKLLTVRNGYHGDTFGAMSVTDPENGMHSMFKGVLPEHLFVAAPSSINDGPWNSAEIEPIRRQLELHADSIAAVIIEPLVQGAGGMRVYHPEYLRQLRALCDQHQVLLIFDEIATGFGRTGSLFAYQQAGVVPDIICLGKALTGGYMTLAATVTQRHVADTISRFEGGNLMHGPTFMANPLACAVANASIDLLLASNWQAKVATIEQQLKSMLFPLRQANTVTDVRVKGAIGVVELAKPLDMHRLPAKLIELGVWLRPFGKLLYTMPPFVIEQQELQMIGNAMENLAIEGC